MVATSVAVAGSSSIIAISEVMQQRQNSPILKASQLHIWRPSCFVRAVVARFRTCGRIPKPWVMAACNLASRPSMALGASKSSFASSFAFKPAALVRVQRPQCVSVEAKRVCELTGKKANKANVVTFSNKHNRKWQQPNLQNKKIWWEHGQRWVTLKICTKAIKTLEKKGIDLMAKEAGIDLWKLPYQDARAARVEYLAQNPGRVPRAKNPRAMKNPIKLANSKTPKQAVYDESGRIYFITASSYEEALLKKEEMENDDTAQLRITVTE